MKSASLLTLATALGSAFALVLERSPGTAGCRCRPSEACWPTAVQWSALNSSIDWNLVSVRPVAEPCHSPTFNREQCDIAIANSNNSVWREEHPGAVQFTNWEAWALKNEYCLPIASENTTCGQGRISLYSAVVEKAEHIQQAVRFASEHNIRLAIKNSGHCYLGRSTAPESLQISTYKMDDITFVNNFYAAGSPASSNCSLGPAVTIGAGVKLAPLYKEAAKRNVSLTIGAAHTVGAAGGYIQGGGHSPLGPAKGMSTDNALEFTVVTANGELVAANQHQNSDLFWALRGGGGGTFGVVASVTLRTFPDFPGFYVGGQVSTNGPADDGFWKTVTAFHKRVPALSDAGISGYYSVLPTNKNNGTLIVYNLFVLDRPDAAPVTEIMDSFKEEATKYNTLANYTVMPVPSVIQTITAGLSESDSDGGGFVGRLGSRLISRDLLSSKDGADRLTKALREIYEDGFDTGYTGHLVAGGAVAANKDVVDSALNPAWRRAITHIVYGRQWPDNATLAEQQTIQHKITNVELAKLRALEPDMGAYLNEADADEKDFQRSFWGANYKRLYQIKQHYDPNGLFIARRGVGSEDWDDAGLCRVKSCPTPA